MAVVTEAMDTMVTGTLITAMATIGTAIKIGMAGIGMVVIGAATVAIGTVGGGPMA
jgi:hypothetical protein